MPENGGTPPNLRSQDGRSFVTAIHQPDMSYFEDELIVPPTKKQPLSCLHTYMYLSRHLPFEMDGEGGQVDSR